MSALGHRKCTVVSGRCRHFSILILWKEKIRWRSLEIKFNGRRRLMSDEEWKWNGGMQFSVRWNDEKVFENFKETPRLSRLDMKKWKPHMPLDQKFRLKLLTTAIIVWWIEMLSKYEYYTCRWEWVDSLDDTTLLTTKLNHLKCDWGICECVWCLDCETLSLNWVRPIHHFGTAHTSQSLESKQVDWNKSNFQFTTSARLAGWFIHSITSKHFACNSINLSFRLHRRWWIRHTHTECTVLEWINCFNYAST